MPLKFEFSNKEDLIYPILVCDYCGKQITDPRASNVLYEQPEFEGKGPWHSAAIHFTHKECDYAFRQNHDTNWIDTVDFVAQLCYHLGMKDVAKRIVAKDVEETRRRSTPKRKSTSE